MRRIVSTLAAAAVIGATVAASPATAAATKGPKLGDWTCADAASAPVASVELFKGNKYAVDGGDKAKYVYKVGQHKMKFKTGAFEDVYYGLFDTETKTLALHAMADDALWATCTYGVAEVPETPETPETPEVPETPEEPDTTP